MAEEIVVQSELDRDFMTRGLVNEPITVRLTLYTRDDFVRDHPVTRCNLVLVVDTSASMDEPFGAGESLTKREGVIRAIESLLPFLQEDDTVSLICFDSGAYVELDRAPGSDPDRIRQAAARINDHRGATNFEAAFSAVQNMLQAHQGGGKRVCFLTDGQATLGDGARAHRINSELAAAGVVVDCLGVGEGFNFKEMQQFTQASGGRTGLLDTPEQAGDDFKSILDEAQQSLIANAALRLELPPGLRDVEIFQLTPESRYFDNVRQEPNGSVSHRINVQTVAQTLNYIFIVQMKVDTPTDSNVPNLMVMRTRFDYDVPVLGLTGQSQENQVVLNLGPDGFVEKRDTSIESDALEVSLTKLDRDVAAAWAGQDWKQVALLLQEMLGRARKLRDDDKCRTYQLQLESLEKNGHLTQAELNKIGKSSTHSNLHRGGERDSNVKGAY